MTHYIPLRQGAAAAVDKCDYDHLRPYDWFANQDGYAVGFVPVNGQFQLAYMHRIILHAVEGEMVDHIDGNRLNNTRSNLRFATPAQNQWNRRAQASATFLKGVGWHKRRLRFHARIQLQGVRVHLGFFDDAETAALAYDCAARILFGEYAQVNYPYRQTPRPVALLVAQRLAKRGFEVPDDVQPGPVPARRRRWTP